MRIRASVARSICGLHCQRMPTLSKRFYLCSRQMGCPCSARYNGCLTIDRYRRTRLCRAAYRHTTIRITLSNIDHIVCTANITSR